MERLNMYQRHCNEKSLPYIAGRSVNKIINHSEQHFAHTNKIKHTPVLCSNNSTPWVKWSR